MYIWYKERRGAEWEVKQERVIVNKVMEMGVLGKKGKGIIRISQYLT